MIACLGSDRFVESGRRRWIGGARKVVEYQIGFVALTCDCQIAKLNPPSSPALCTLDCAQTQILDCAQNRFSILLQIDSYFNQKQILNFCSKNHILFYNKFFVLIIFTHAMALLKRQHSRKFSCDERHGHYNFDISCLYYHLIKSGGKE